MKLQILTRLTIRSAFSISILFVFFSVCFNYSATAQQATTDLEMVCIQTKDELKFEFTLLASGGETKNFPAVDQWVYLYDIGGEEEVLIDSVKTEKDGKAKIVKPKTGNYLMDEAGSMKFISRTMDNDNFESAESYDIQVKPAFLEISFEETDDKKQVIVKGFEIDPENGEIPMDGYDVYLYVPRMFSLLNVGEVYLDEGEGSAPFPTTLPGDSIGNLSIIAKIEDDDVFANVMTFGNKDWGKPRPPVVVSPRRGLGDTDAPLWMVYTLIVLLTLVWFHFAYVFYNLYRIKKSGKE